MEISCEGKMSSGGCAGCDFLSDCLKNNPSADELLQEDRERLSIVLPPAEKEVHRDGCLN